MPIDYNQYSTSGQGDLSPLPEGVYTSNPKSKDKRGESLKIIKELAVKEVKGGATRHTFLVGSDDERGTGFLKIDLHPWSLRPETIAMALGKKPKDASGNGHFFISPEVLAQLDAAAVDSTQKELEEIATAKVAEANTPDEQVGEAISATLHKMLVQVQINVGTIFRLQDWAGYARNPEEALLNLEGVYFEGSVKAGLNDSVEISVFSKKKDAAPAAKATDFPVE